MVKDVYFKNYVRLGELIRIRYFSKKCILYLCNIYLTFDEDCDFHIFIRQLIHLVNLIKYSKFIIKRANMYLILSRLKFLKSNLYLRNKNTSYLGSPQDD